MNRVVVVGLMLVAAPATFAAEEYTPTQVTSPILTDGVCDDRAYERVAGSDVGSGATLYLLQDELHLYVCVDYPPRSLGAGDFYFVDPQDGGLLNLHVSAQKGERKQNLDGSWPDYVWENQKDWFANVVVMKWSRETGYECCHPSSAREMQIRKSKIFNEAGQAHMMFTMGSIRTPDGNPKGTALFPSGASLENQQSWATIRLGD